jgi:hypothetical protein
MRRARIRPFLLAALTAGAFGILAPAAHAAGSCLNSTIASNFNGTAIPGGSYIWFNANFKASGTSGKNVTIRFTNSTIKFSSGGTSYNVAVPNATITFSTSATTATTVRTGSGEWITTVPSGFGDDVFVSGVAFHVPAGGLPGGINPVTWTGTFTSSSPGTGISWKWGAAVYNPTPEAAEKFVEPKPVHSTSLDKYKNSDQAGTPENFKQFLIGGARGGGGSNFTGSWSGTNSCETPQTPPGKPHVFLGYVDEAANNHGSPSAHPNPWKGSPGVIFVGCGFGGTNACPKEAGFDLYDAGAIRIDATTESGALNVTGGKVVIGPCAYEPWPGLNVTAQPGQSLILTQTGKHQCTPTATAEQTNFDTSESFLKSSQYQEFLKTGKCSNDGFIPSITLTINGQTLTLSDKGQVLNTGGLDPDICTGVSEVREWSQIL